MIKAEAARAEQVRAIRNRTVKVALEPIEHLRAAFQRLTTAATIDAVLGILLEALGTEFSRVALFDVTANCIAPGFIATAMTDKLNEKQRESILGRVPAGRLGSGEDIAAAAVYLASDEASYVTGQTLHINGGMAMI